MQILYKTTLSLTTNSLGFILCAFLLVFGLLLIGIPSLLFACCLICIIAIVLFIQEAKIFLVSKDSLIIKRPLNFGKVFDQKSIPLSEIKQILFAEVQKGGKCMIIFLKSSKQTQTLTLTCHKNEIIPFVNTLRKLDVRVVNEI
jgi:hypothetical protein